MFQSAPAIDGGRSGVSLQSVGQRNEVSIRARHRWRAIRFARNSLLSNHIFDVQREHDDQAHLVARRRHKSTDQFQQTQ